MHTNYGTEISHLYPLHYAKLWICPKCCYLPPWIQHAQLGGGVTPAKEQC